MSDIEQEIDSFFKGVARLSKLMPRLSSEDERRRIAGKKAIFVIKGLSRAYALQVQGDHLAAIDDVSGADTICYAHDPRKFLEYCDRVFNEGNGAAFERALQRGDLVIRGKHAIHDRIMWRQAFERVAKARQAYAS